jgi:hypothetical protein
MAPLASGLPEAFTGQHPALPLSDASSLMVDMIALLLLGGPGLMLAGAARLVTTVLVGPVECTCGRCP